MNLILEFLLTYPNFLIIDQLRIEFCRITGDNLELCGPRLLLLCVNDSEYSSDLLEPRISADDRNFFPNDKIDYQQRIRKHKWFM